MESKRREMQAMSVANEQIRCIIEIKNIQGDKKNIKKMIKDNG